MASSDKKNPTVKLDIGATPDLNVSDDDISFAERFDIEAIPTLGLYEEEALS